MKQRLEKILQQYAGQNCIVFTDLYGGSVNQIFFKNLRNYSFHLITGMNLAMILECVFTETDLDGLALKGNHCECLSSNLLHERLVASLRGRGRLERKINMISLLRVDGRLVHGMVAVTWVGELKPNVLVVANDAAANDSFHTMTLKLAKPANVDMYVWTLAKAVDRLNGPKYKAKKIFITVSTIADAEALVSQCPEIRRVNVGPEVDGTKGRVTEGKVEISDGVFASPVEFACLKRIHDQGVEVFAQITPQMPAVDFTDFAKKFE